MASSVSMTYMQDQAASLNSWDETYKWLLAWMIAIILLSLINKSRLGHIAIYYWLVSLIIFLIVTQYKFIVQALGPVGAPAPQGGQK